MKTEEERIQELENEGCTRSDAQGIVEAEDMRAADKYPLRDWKYEVANGDTRLGYQDWVFHRIEADAG